MFKLFESRVILLLMYVYILFFAALQSPYNLLISLLTLVTYLHVVGCQ